MTTTTTTAIADSVGALLRQAREESGLSRATVAFRTKIPERYVTGFEDGMAPGTVEDAYTKIYLKAYAKFLGFEAATLVDLYRKERERTMPRPTERRTAPVKRHPSVPVQTSALVVTPKIIQAALLGLVALGLVAYFGFEVKKIIAPPQITLIAPDDGLVTVERSLVIEGRTEGEVTLRVNGKPVSPDSNGNFRDSLDLQEGLNVVTVVGAKKHSKEMTVTRRIIVLPRERPTAELPTAAEDIPGL